MVKIDTELVAVNTLGADVTEMAIQEKVQRWTDAGWTLQATATIPESDISVAAICLIFGKETTASECKQIEYSEDVADMLERWQKGEGGIGLEIIRELVQDSDLKQEVKDLFLKQYATGRLFPEDFRPKQVWANECRLVVTREGDGGEPNTVSSRRGEMGLDHFVEGHKSAQSFRVTLESFDPLGKHETFSELEGVPVRVVIYRVLGGHA